MNVLNVAAGFLPLDRSDFGVNRVVNYDPLQYSRNTYHLMLLLKEIDVDYVSRAASVDSIYPNGSVDLILSISPFGFALVDDWLHNKLRPGGYILAFGNERNKWLQADQMFTDRLQEQYRFLSWSGAPEPKITEIAQKVKTNYQSSATDLHHDTTLNEIVCAIKKVKISS